jgi:hypothetical protein
MVCVVRRCRFVVKSEVANLSSLWLYCTVGQ